MEGASVPEMESAHLSTIRLEPEDETVVLYDGSLEGTPDSQGFTYLTYPVRSGVTGSYEDGATRLDSTAARGVLAGYFSRPSWMPSLDAGAGYSVLVTLQILSESHDERDDNGDRQADRSGFSLIVLDREGRGIELGFWEDAIWAQADGRQPPGSTLFTHAEGVAFDTTAGLEEYVVRVRGEEYTLSVNGEPNLSGPLRDYSAFTGPIDPYETPNFLFLGDNTSSADSLSRLGYVAITVEPRNISQSPETRAETVPPSRLSRHNLPEGIYCD